MGEKHSTAGVSLLWIHWLPSPGAERTYKYAVFTDKEIQREVYCGGIVRQKSHDKEVEL